MQRILPVALVSLSLLGVQAAQAHLTLTSPPVRDPDSNIKFGPCGANSTRTTDPEKISAFAPGETITMTWIEVVDHDPAHYRVAFSKDGDTEFVDPTGYEDTTTQYPELLDGIVDADAGTNHPYSVTVTLPNEPCDNCTLQVIQVMHDKPPWGGGDDIYYQCADIIIEGEPVAPPEPGTGGTPGLPVGTGGTPDPGAPVTGSGGTLDSGMTGGNGADTPSDPNDPGDTSGDGEVGSSDGTTSETGGCSYAASSSRPAWLLFLSTALLGAMARRRRVAPGGQTARSNGRA